MAASISTLPPPTFVTDADGLDPNLILADMITAFEQSSGRTLYPAQVERLLINLYTYRESLVRNAIQYAGQQNLLAFAVYPLLDYIGQLMDTPRLGAVGTPATLQFNLANALTQALTIAANTGVGTYDGQLVFQTTETLTIPAGVTSATVAAICTTAGTAGNGYLAGQVNVLLLPNALIASVANTATTANGSASEMDDHYRARIQIAPNQFSTAGPSGAYEYFALSTSPSIVDANVNSPAPGSVNMTVLTGPIVTQPAASPNNVGIASSALLSQVLTALSAKTVRPLCDTVTAAAVTEVDYTITATVTLYADATQATTMAAANTAAVDLALELANEIQRNLVPSQWVTALSVSGVYDVEVTIAANIGGTPITPDGEGRIILTAGEWVNCTAITLTPETGSEDEES